MTLILSGTDGLSDVDGSAATPAIRGTDANTGIFFPAADTIAFSEGGVESMRIDASGNVGIGTSSPGTRLDVVGVVRGTYNANWTGGPTVHGFEFRNAGTTTKALVGGYDGSRGAYIQAVNFGTAYENLVLQPNGGNLGLGVTPSAWSGFSAVLQQRGGSHVVGDTGAFMQIGANNYYNGTNWIYTTTAPASRFVQNNGLFQWYNAASGTAGNTISFTQAMTLDASGNLGVGVTDPASYGSVFLARPASGANFGVRTLAGIGGSGTGVALDSLNNGASSVVDFGIRGNTIQFRTSSAEAARIDSSGNLLVGATNSSASAGNGFKINPNGIGSGIPQISIVGNSTDNSYGTYSIYSSSAAQYQFYVGYGGTVYARSTSITGLSDQREKENIRTLDVGLNEVLSLQPRRFDWKDGSALNVAGFVAQEVQQVLPDLIEEYKINDEENRLGLKMGDMIPTLVKAIQEQQALITTLTDRITALENK
jgi:hypothetical protein